MEAVAKRSPTGAAALALRSYVRGEMAVEVCFDTVMGELGMPDILVNFAGLNMASDKVADMDFALWQHMICTDLSGTFLICRRFVRDLRRAGRGGTIINVTPSMPTRSCRRRRLHGGGGESEALH